MKYINVAVIGIGNMGSAHAACIAENGINGMSLAAVCDISEKKLVAFSEKYPTIKRYENYEQLFNDKICDNVIIAVPHPLHSEIAIKAFENGLNVMLEKPADISVSRVKKLNVAAEKSGKVFSVMFNQRTNPLFAKAREIVRGGELGELKRSVWIITNWYRTQNYYDSGSWRATWRGEGGGVLLNQAPHNLDIWQWICGMPIAVTAFCNVGKFHNIEVEDEATIYAEYENGATGVFITSTGDCPGTNRFEITGTRGKIVLENGVLKLWKLKEDERDICKNAVKGFISPDTEYSEFTAEKETAHAGILKNFTDAILYGRELLSPGYDGINELMISNAAYLSEWTGNKKVTLPFDTDEFDRLLAERQKNSGYRAGAAEKIGNADYLPRWQVRW